MNLIQKILLTLIILLTVSTRFIRLDSAPPHLSNDEISIAYDAYSIANTGRDEHNHHLPLSFQSHNTYKAPLAIYLAVLPTKIFGNNEYSVRLPSALLGSLTILMIGLLVWELTGNLSLSLVASLILSITPWHIYTSRMALESNMALFFVVAGIYLFYRGLNKDNKMLSVLSFIAFALSIYGYHTEWGLTPLIIMVLLILNFKKIINKKIYLMGLVLFFLLICPIFMDYLHNLHTNARANTELITSDVWLSRIFENNNLNFFQKKEIIFNAVLNNYSAYLNPGYLFFKGLELLPNNNPYQSGLFLSPLLPCLFIGLFNIKKYFKNNSKILLILTFLTPLIPAMTRGDANMVRNLVAVVPYTILISIGLMVIFGYWKNKKIYLLIYSGWVLISLGYFLMIYFIHFPIHVGERFQYGYKQAALFIKNNYNQYDKIVVDPRFGDYNLLSGVPHLYIPYHTKLDAHKLLERQDLPTGLFFDKYEIRDINWGKEFINKNYLYLVPVSNKPQDDRLKQLKNLLEIELPDHKASFEIYSSL